ncbi:MAG: hypothetical protein PUH33_07375 [Clostridiaceae bacterium]|nr:hypothetical protein [Clostridiaceae bacterium]
MSDYNTEYVYKGKVKHCCKYCGRPVRFSENEELRSKLSSTVSVDEQGYAISLDATCSECSVKVAKKAGKGFKKLLIFLVIVALIGGGLLVFKNCVFGNSGLYEWAMSKKLNEYEKSDKLIEDYVLFESGADYTLETLKGNIESNDYKMRYYSGDGNAEVIKYTLSDEVFIQWSFSDGFSELSNKTFVLRDGVIYEDGDQKIAYNSSSKKYSEIMDKLSAYLPENCCCKGSYTSADELDDPEQKLIAHIIKGDSDTVLYEVTEDKYYEKTADIFIYLEITGPTEGDSVIIPEKSDYTAAE